MIVLIAHFYLSITYSDLMEAHLNCYFENSKLVYYCFSKLFSYYFSKNLIDFTKFHQTSSNFSTNNENYI